MYQRDNQKQEFEQAGFTDFDAKLKAWTDAEQGGPLQVYFPAPPVCTARWDTQAWLRFVDWTLPANAKALESARKELGQ